MHGLLGVIPVSSTTPAAAWHVVAMISVVDLPQMSIIPPFFQAPAAASVGWLRGASCAPRN